jgi:hypothetical protein
MGSISEDIGVMSAESDTPTATIKKHFIKNNKFILKQLTLYEQYTN